MERDPDRPEDAPEPEGTEPGAEDAGAGRAAGAPDAGSAAAAIEAFRALSGAQDAPSFEEWVRRYPGREAELRHALAESELELEPDGGAGAGPPRIGSSETFFHRTVGSPAAAGDVTPTMAELVPGRVVGGFRLVRRIAQGGMGQVWEAEQVSLRRPVAMKFIRPDRLTDRAIAFFGREGRAGGRLNHPGVVTVYETGETDGVHWIASELVTGGCTLRTFLDDMLALAELPRGYHRRVAAFFVQLCDAMQVAHDAGVIHRDLKPQNILVTPDDRPKITDFGLARLVDEASLSEPIALQGTPCYMSPEQVVAKSAGIDPRTDVFSLGAILYEVLTLRRPFEGETEPEIFERILLDDPPHPRALRPQIPADLAVICLKALEKRRSDRYGSMRDFGDDLRRFRDHEPIHARPPSAWQRARRQVRRHPTAATAAAFALVLLGGGGWAAWQVGAAGREALRQQKANLVLRAEYAIDNANLREVEAVAAEYASLDPTDFLPKLLLARGYSLFLHTSEAEEAYRAAREMGYEPGAPEGEDARALYLHALELVIERDPARQGEALRRLERAIELDPDLRSAHFLRYQLCKEAGDLAAADRALAAFQRTLATGDDYWALTEAIRAELGGRYQDAIDALRELEERVDAERAAELRLDRILGRLYLARAGEPRSPGSTAPLAYLQTAEERLRTAVERVPTDAGSWVNLGTVAVRKYLLDPGGANAADHLERALEHGRRAAEEHPRYAPALGLELSARVFQAERRMLAMPTQPPLDLLDEVDAAVARLRALDPDFELLDRLAAHGAFLRAEILALQGDAERAEELYLQSIELDPRQVVPYLLPAMNAYMRGEHDRAYELLVAAQDALVRYAHTDVVRTLHPDVRARLDVWTVGAAAQIGTEEAVELGRRARTRVDAALAARPVSPIEILNYAEFLATSPTSELRDCDRAREVLAEHRPGDALRGTPWAGAAEPVQRLVDDCD